MKKIVLALVCVVMLTGCFPAKTGLVETKAENVVAAIEEKDTFILLVGKTDCSACTDFKKVIDEFVTNYDVRISEVLIDKEVVKNEETGENESPDFDALEQHIGVVGGTPSGYFIKEGVVTGSFTGSISYENFKKKVEKYGFLPE